MGIILLLHPQISLTGATIGTPRATLSWLSGLGLLVIVVSILLLLSLSREERRSKLEEKLAGLSDSKVKIKVIERAYRQGIIDQDEAANKINKYVPLKGLTYKRDVQLTIEAEDSSRRYSLESKADDHLAYAIQDRILQNNPMYIQNIQLHISKEESTKHHRKGLKR